MSSWLLRASPHVLAGSLCGGLAGANLLRVGRPLVALLAVLLAATAAATVGSARFVCLALALAVAGAWWGSVRLTALDRSMLAAHIGETARVRAAVTGPARRSRFQVRVPAQVRRLDRQSLREAHAANLARTIHEPPTATAANLGLDCVTSSISVLSDQTGRFRAKPTVCLAIPRFSRSRDGAHE